VKWKSFLLAVCLGEHIQERDRDLSLVSISNMEILEDAKSFKKFVDMALRNVV